MRMTLRVLWVVSRDYKFVGVCFFLQKQASANIAFFAIVACWKVGQNNHLSTTEFYDRSSYDDEYIVSGIGAAGSA